MKFFFGCRPETSSSSRTAIRNSVIIYTLFLGFACLLLSSSASSAQSLKGSNCPHIKVLEKRDAGQVNSSYRDKVENPEPSQIRYLEKATQLFTPILCQAVRRVVFIDLTAKPGVGGWTQSNETQDMVYLNSTGQASWNYLKIAGSPTAQAKAIQKFVHESTHAAVRMIQSQQKSSPAPHRDEFLDVDLTIPGLINRPEPQLWSGTAIAIANAVIEKLRLEKGVIREWTRMHESFQAFGLAGEYYGGDWSDEGYDNLDHEENGFTTAYGGAAPIEDIAELTGWAVAGHLFTGGARADYKDRACQTLGNHQEKEVPGHLAAVYAKLSFLQSLGFIDKQSFQRCVGKVGLDISNPGFHRVGGGQAGRSYVQGLKGSLGLDEDTENWVFIARAEGAVSFGGESATGEFSLKLTVADGSDERILASWPRGIYSLAGDFSYFSNDGKTVPGENQFWLKVKNHPAATLVSIQGLALVIDGSDGMLEGSIVLQKTLRPFAPMPVPQVVPGRLLFQLPPTRD